MLQKNGFLTRVEIDSILQVTSVDLGPGGKDNDYGAGRIDALNAVNGTPPPFSLRPLAHHIDDPAPGGNNNGYWESSEQVNLVVPIYNQSSDTARSSIATLTTGDPYVTINSGNVNLGSVAPYDTVIATFVVTAAAGTPAMHLANFNLNLAHQGGNWDYGLSVYINPLPLLTYQSVSVTGGNGNGILDPGEMANLIVTIENEGPATAINVTSTLTTSSPYITINDNSGNFGTINPGNQANNSADPYNVTASATTPTGTMAQFNVIVVSGSYIDTLALRLVVGRKD